MNTERKIEYMEARIAELERIVSTMISYHQAMYDRYQTCPNPAYFWQNEMQMMREQAAYRLDNMEQGE